MDLLFTVFVSWKSGSVCIILYINSTKVIEKSKEFYNFYSKLQIWLYVLHFRSSQSNFQGRLQPLLVVKVTGLKGTSVFTLFLISFGKITIVAAIHKKKSHFTSSR